MSVWDVVMDRLPAAVPRCEIMETFLLPVGCLLWLSPGYGLDGQEKSCLTAPWGLLKGEPGSSSSSADIILLYMAFPMQVLLLMG